MGFLAPKQPSTPQRDPELDRQQREAEEKARKEAEAEKARKREEQQAFAKGLRGQRALLSGSFTGVSGSGADGRGFFTPTG